MSVLPSFKSAFSLLAEGEAVDGVRAVDDSGLPSPHPLLLRPAAPPCPRLQTATTASRARHLDARPLSSRPTVPPLPLDLLSGDAPAFGFATRLAKPARPVARAKRARMESPSLQRLTPHSGAPRVHASPHAPLDGMRGATAVHTDAHNGSCAHAAGRGPPANSRPSKASAEYGGAPRVPDRSDMAGRRHVPASVGCREVGAAAAAAVLAAGAGDNLTAGGTGAGLGGARVQCSTTGTQGDRTAAALTRLHPTSWMSAQKRDGLTWLETDGRWGAGWESGAHGSEGAAPLLSAMAGSAAAVAAAAAAPVAGVQKAMSGADAVGAVADERHQWSPRAGSGCKSMQLVASAGPSVSRRSAGSKRVLRYDATVLSVANVLEDSTGKPDADVLGSPMQPSVNSAGTERTGGPRGIGASLRLGHGPTASDLSMLLEETRGRVERGGAWTASAVDETGEASRNGSRAWGSGEGGDGARNSVVGGMARAGDGWDAREREVSTNEAEGSGAEEQRVGRMAAREKLKVVEAEERGRRSGSDGSVKGAEGVVGQRQEHKQKQKQKQKQRQEDGQEQVQEQEQVQVQVQVQEAGDQGRESEEGKEDGEESESVQCPHCARRLRNAVTLQNHVRVVHDHSGSYRCGQCSGTFMWRSTLRNHVRLVHEKQRPHRCDECDKGFRWGSHLQEHYSAVHRGEKPFRCPTCAKTFGRKNNMQKHMRKHATSCRPR